MKRTMGCLLIGLCGISGAVAQDTLRLSLAEADALLQQRSLALVAQRYAVEAADAERVQARLFHNPTLSTEWSVRTDGSPRFHVAQPDGQMAVHVEQLFRIAGQRSLAVKAAAQRTRLAEAEYAELAAALRYRLHAAMYRQYHTHHAVEAIGSQLDLLKQLVDAYGLQLERGNVSLREVARLRTAYFQLNDQRTRLRTELNALQQELRTLLMEERPVRAALPVDELEMVRALPADSLTLIELAQANRPLVLAAEAGLAAGELELKLQRRLGVPDLAIGGTYDRESNYIHDYTGLNVGLSVPLFDRNQGHIKRARAEAEAARAHRDQVRQHVRQEVLRALADLRALQQHYLTTSQGLDAQLDQLSESLMDNYVKSNLSLLEFTDLFESYTNGIIAINALKADLQQAHEELEYVTGQRLFER
ncbi:MAG: TolC family protein [Flavobacteriales bacterium]|jgi:cobalt-zinc-cadmium efflux system outer membrane protein|nr:TolC family protein [Flavobacteriales bacterium]